MDINKIKYKKVDTESDYSWGLNKINLLFIKKLSKISSHRFKHLEGAIGKDGHDNIRNGQTLWP